MPEGVHLNEAVVRIVRSPMCRRAVAYPASMARGLLSTVGGHRGHRREPEAETTKNHPRTPPVQPMGGEPDSRRLRAALHCAERAQVDCARWQHGARPDCLSGL